MKTALWAGIPYSEIGCRTPEEIQFVAETETERQKDFYKMLAWLVYSGASLTAIGFNDPKKFPSLEEAFPSLFEQKGQQDWWVMKQRMEDWAKAKKATSDAGNQ